MVFYYVMEPTGINLYGIAHVKVYIIAGQKMYHIIPTLGRFQLSCVRVHGHYLSENAYNVFCNSNYEGYLTSTFDTVQSVY